MRKSILVLTAWFLLYSSSTILASSQDSPKAEFFGGYSFARRPGIMEPSLSLHGWNISGARSLNHLVGLAADVRWSL